MLVFIGLVADKTGKATSFCCCHPAPPPCDRAEQRSGRRIRASDCLSEVQRSEFELDPACREQGCLGSESKFAEPKARPKGETKSKEICALTPKTPDPEFVFD